MIEPLSPQALSWVRQSAATGCVTSRVLVNLLERVEALEAAQQPPAPQPAPAIFPVEYADADGDGIRIAMEPAVETGRACWVVRNSRHVNPCLEFSTPEAAHAAHQAAQPAQSAPIAAPPANGESGYTDQEWAEVNRWRQESSDLQPAPPVMQRLMEAPMDTRGYVNLREPPAAPPAALAGGLVELVAAEIYSNYPNLYRGEARAAIREVARWIRSELISRSVADRLEQEADR